MTYCVYMCTSNAAKRFHLLPRIIDQMVPTWDSLDSYIANYAGRTKIHRLLHISKTLKELQPAADSLVLDIIRAESFDTETYKKVLAKMNVSDEDELRRHHAWLSEATKNSTALTQKLETELKAYKNNLIKESIRLGQQDIANHQIKTGDLITAHRTFIRNRDYCTTPLHMFQVNMNTIYISILLGQWSQVQNHLTKLQSGSLQIRQEDQNHINVATALEFLSQKNYEQSARMFLQVEASIGTSYNNVISMNDIANFTCILALATFSREDNLKLIESTAFKPFLELEVLSREALAAFHKRRYAECLKLLSSFKADLIADVYFSSHVGSLYELIKERSYLQFLSTFSKVPLARMATEFAVTPAEIETSLCNLIMQKKLTQVRIDMKNGLIVREPISVHESNYLKSIESGTAYCRQVNAALTHLALTYGNLQVDAPRHASSMPGLKTRPIQKHGRGKF